MYFISTDQAALNVPLIHEFLTHSYWARGISLTLINQSIENSLCFGAYLSDKKSPSEHQQVGFARIITDYTTFAYLADVFVLPAHRGKGISKMLMSAISEHKSLQSLRRMMLVTADAHELYQKYGFTPLNSPEKVMEKHQPNIYQATK